MKQTLQVSHVFSALCVCNVIICLLVSSFLEPWCPHKPQEYLRPSIVSVISIFSSTKFELDPTIFSSIKSSVKVYYYIWWTVFKWPFKHLWFFSVAPHKLHLTWSNIWTDLTCLLQLLLSLNSTPHKVQTNEFTWSSTTSEILNPKIEKNTTLNSFFKYNIS